MTEQTQPRPALLDQAVRVAGRWIAENRYRWHIYHTNVTHLALLRLWDATGISRYAQHVAEAHRYYCTELSAELLAPDYHMHTFGLAELALWERLKNPAFVDLISRGSSFDAASARQLARELDTIAARQLGQLLEKQPRARDGCFTLKKRSWVFVDSLAGFIPFLARAGRLFGDPRCFEEACSQIHRYCERLRDPQTGLYCQGEGFGIFPNWPARKRRRTEGAWARGNGWMMLAMVELLDALPANHPDRSGVKRLLSDFVEALAFHQDGEGMWHQVVDRPDSYPELSGTCLFLYGMARARARGWLEGDLLPLLERGCRGIQGYVDSEANIRGVCIGTPFQLSEQDYCDLPAPLNDLHGHGPFILVCCELSEEKP